MAVGVDISLESHVLLAEGLYFLPVTSWVCVTSPG